MSVGAIIMIVMCMAGFAVLIAAALLGSRYADDLNKKLSALLDNPVINTKYYSTSSISGTYRGHSITFEWSPPGFGRLGDSGTSVNACVKIHDINIPTLEMNFQSDLPDKQLHHTTNLWQELSDLRSIQEITFADHVLQIKMQWGTPPRDIGSAIFFGRTFADQLSTTIDTTHIAQEIGMTLNKVLEIL